MSWAVAWMDATWRLLCESAPFLLLGFFLAGLIKTVISTDRIHRHLGENSFRSVWRAALYGIPIPLCSCSVIPTATSLRKNGASEGATASFLISTPETGVDSIGVTWALLDPLMTVVRPVAALASALLSGGLVNLLVRRREARPEPAAPLPGGPDFPAPASCCSTPPAPAPPPAPSASCCHEPAAEAQPEASTWSTRLGDAARYGYGPLLDDLTPWFVIGFLLSGLIAALTPADLFADAVPGGWPAMLLMLVVGLPLYVCATASTPIAAVLISKGLSPGAALVFLLVGPATNLTTLMVVRSLLGKGVLSLYLIGIVTVALLSGFLVNALYPALGMDLAVRVGDALHHHPGPLAKVAGAILLLLILLSARRIRLFARWKQGFALSPAEPGPQEPAPTTPSTERDEPKVAS